MMTTKASGASMAGCPLEIEILSIICMNMITRKYKLAIFVENCSNKLRGKNDHHVYFEVRTMLLLMSFRFHTA